MASAIPVTATAMLQCSFGAAPGTFMVLPVPTIPMLEGKPVGTLMDNLPMVNIMPFGACSAPTNPAVIAALGSPVPCVPVTVAPWIPGGAPTVLINKKPVLTSNCKLMCTWMGIIQVTNPGATKEMVP